MGPDPLWLQDPQAHALGWQAHEHQQLPARDGGHRLVIPRGQRCLIPALDYDEPYWGAGRNIWWRFARADGQPWALAGIWAEWTDPETGEVVRSYTVLTQNCDAHPLLNQFHKPDPKLPAHQQDKRSIVSIEREHWDQWLNGSIDQATDLIQLSARELFRHGAAEPTKQVNLPIPE